MAKKTRQRVYDRGEQLTLVLRAQLGNGTDKLVLLVLLDFYGQNENCVPSYETIAECANISRRSAITAVKRLKDAGIVSVRGRVDPAGDQTSNQYFINFEALEALRIVHAEASDGSEGDSPPRSDAVSPGGEGDSPQVVNVLHHGGERRSPEPPTEPPIGTDLSAPARNGELKRPSANAPNGEREPKPVGAWVREIEQAYPTEARRHPALERRELTEAIVGGVDPTGILRAATALQGDRDPPWFIAWIRNRGWEIDRTSPARSAWDSTLDNEETASTQGREPCMSSSRSTVPTS